MSEPNYEQVDCDQPLPEGRIRELAEGKANPWPIDSQILAREVLALRAKLAECVGNPLAGNPAEWGHADQIAGLGAQLITTRAKLAEAEAEMSGLRLAALEVIVHWDFKMTCEDDKMESLIHDLRLAVDPLMRPDAAPTPEVPNE